MTQSETDQLGTKIGDLSKDQDDLHSQISPDEAGALLQSVSLEKVSIGGTLKVIKRTYPTDSFILDHPVYGELDSSVLKLNGGYAEEIAGFTFPGTFTITFSAISEGSEVLVEKSL